MRLPPLTFTEAANLYKRIVESEGDILALVGDEREMLLHLASALVTFGRQLERDQEVIQSYQATIHEQAESLDELNFHLRAYIDEATATALDADHSDEPPAPVMPFLPAGEEVIVDPHFQDGPITAVEWRGPGNGPGGYFDNFEEINKGLAEGISEMAKQHLSRGPSADRVFIDDAIETTEGDTGPVSDA